MIRKRYYNKRALNKLLENKLNNFLIHRALENTIIYRISIRENNFAEFNEFVDFKIFKPMNNLEFSFFFKDSKNSKKTILYFGIKSIIGHNPKLLQFLKGFIGDRYEETFIEEVTCLNKQDITSIMAFDDYSGTLLFDAFKLEQHKCAEVYDAIYIRNIEDGRVEYAPKRKYSLANKIKASRNVDQAINLLSNFFRIKGYKVFGNKVVMNKKTDIIIYNSVENLLIDLENILLELGEIFPYEIYLLDVFRIKFELFKLQTSLFIILANINFDEIILGFDLEKQAYIAKKEKLKARNK